MITMRLTDEELKKFDEIVEYFYSKKMISSMNRTAVVKDFLLQKTYKQMLLDKEKTKKEDYQKYLNHKQS